MIRVRILFKKRRMMMKGSLKTVAKMKGMLMRFQRI